MRALSLAHIISRFISAAEKNALTSQLLFVTCSKHIISLSFSAYNTDSFFIVDSCDAYRHLDSNHREIRSDYSAHFDFCSSTQTHRSFAYQS